MKNFLGKVKDLFVGLAKKALEVAKSDGFRDELIHMALPYVRKANERFVDNNEKREWVVGALVAKKVPESFARLAVELAYRLYRKELNKLGV